MKTSYRFSLYDWEKTRYRFLYRIGSIYHWESVLPLPGGTRHDHITCHVDYFWSRSAS
jgi:hypothetical protein